MGDPIRSDPQGRGSPPPRLALSVGREDLRGRIFDATPHDYVRAVLEAGGIPLLLPPLPPALIPDALSGIDGLILTGGGDVDPGLYGATPDPRTTDVDEARDASELALLDAAGRLALPVLGICRGAQLINVAYGGTLLQELDDGHHLAHRQPARRYEAVHEVTVRDGSRLATLVPERTVAVNSLHHQGVDRLAGGLVATAFAEDGLVEAFEADEADLIAVQWHPECQPDEPTAAALFRWIVDAAGADRRRDG